MSLARAFTKRLQRTESKRPNISGPVHLISSTNMDSYNAPDISSLKIQTGVDNSQAHNSSASARSSSERSDRSHRSNQPGTPSITEPALTDASSVEGSPVSSPVLEENHLSAYFPGPTKPKQKPDAHQLKSDSNFTTEVKDYAPQAPRPSLPSRAPSHSKREHEVLARKRSMRSVSKTRDVTASIANDDVFSTPASPAPEVDPEHTPKPQHQSSPPAPSHPFSRELAQLNEVAEEFERDTREAENDVDAWIMERLGLGKFTAADYACLIVDPLAPGGMFSEQDYRESCWV